MIPGAAPRSGRGVFTDVCGMLLLLCLEKLVSRSSTECGACCSHAFRRRCSGPQTSQCCPLLSDVRRRATGAKGRKVSGPAAWQRLPAADAEGREARQKCLGHTKASLGRQLDQRAASIPQAAASAAHLGATGALLAKRLAREES